MTEKIVTYHLTREERETHYYFTDGESYCICDTTIPKDIRKLKSKGWEMISCDKRDDGSLVAARFKAPANHITPRTYSPAKPKRTISDEHKRRMQESRKNNSN